MRKADVVLVVLGVVAAGATAVAVAKSDDWTGERTYRFATTDPAFAAGDARPAGPAPARFEVPAPANATAVLADVVVEFTGQPVQGGTAIVRVSGTAPDGSSLPTLTRAWELSGTSGEVSIAYNATWLAVPDEVRDTRHPEGRAWTDPLVVLVTVERPSDVALATYSFTARVGGSFVAYAAI